ncbi:E3 ubiquitin-protein ligase RNF213 isoform X2 [Pleurodeles waltl]|uniref:E3 ubiquitin-protein ligase RNF213 isoform X2 n=1 Tax=Pleurodeles waltl TaxID=8319 RepID=UPI0037096329
MKCEVCQHLSRDASPKFCSECGARFRVTAVGAQADTKPVLVSEVDILDKEKMWAQGEQRDGDPSTSKAEDNSSADKKLIRLFPEESDTSLPMPSVPDNPSLEQQKKKKKKRNRKKKQKNFLSEETDSLTSLSSETSGQDSEVLRNETAEQGDSLAYLGSEKGSLLSDPLAGIQKENDMGKQIIFEEKKLPLLGRETIDVSQTNPASSNPSPHIDVRNLLTSSGNTAQALGDSGPVNKVTKDSPQPKSLILVQQSASPPTEASDQCSSGGPPRFPHLQEGSAPVPPLSDDPFDMPSTVEKIDQCNGINHENSMQEGPPRVDVGNKEKTSSQSETATDNKVLSKTRCSSNSSYAAAVVKGTPSASDESGANATITERHKAEDQSKKGNIDQANTKMAKEDQADHLKEKENNTSKNGDESSSKERSKGQANSRNSKEEQNVSEKVEESTIKTVPHSEASSVKEKDHDNPEKKTDSQTNSENKKLRKQKNKNPQENPKEQKKPGNTENLKEKDEKNKKNKNKPESCERSLNFEHPVTVYFHAIISNDFKVDPEKHKVVIRAGGIHGYQDWRDDVCEMHCSKTLGEHGMLFEGMITVSKTNMNKCIPYKYCIVRGGKFEYEHIYKLDVPEGTIVNRCLNINEKYLNKGEWHQYDDIVCVRPEKGLMKQLMTFVGLDNKKRSLLKGKEIAGEIMLDCIFNTLTTLDSTNLNSFLFQLHQFYFVSCNPMVHENEPKKWTSLQFGETEVNRLLLEALNKIGQPFLSNGNASGVAENTIVKNRLATGLIILTVGEYYNLPTSKQQLNDLCRLICPNKTSKAEILADLRNMRDIFSCLNNMKQLLLNLCQRCIEERAILWVCVLPVLHFFSSSFDSDQSVPPTAHLQQEDIWAGLEGFPFHNFVKHLSPRPLVALMKNKQYLLEVDRVLGRSWFCLLPLESVPEFLAEVQIDVLDALMGTYYRLRNVGICYINEKNVQSLLEKLLKTMETPKDSARQQEAARISLKIHSELCQHTKEKYFSEIPPLSASIFFKFARSASSEEISKSEGPRENNALLEVQKDTKSWFRTVLPKQLSVNANFSYTLRDELKIWDRFVKIAIPCKQLADLWITSLLADLEGRIKQGGSDILGRLNKYNLSKFANLLTAVITNSWPTRADGKYIDDFDKVLEHLHSWPGVRHIFKLYGADGQLLVELSDDAKMLMAVADSVFMDIAEKLTNGTLLWRHLECILKNKTQFLCIWDLKLNHLSGQNTKHGDQMRQVLVWRQNEMRSLKQQREWVDCLLMMCRNVEEIIKVDTDEIMQLHLADIGSIQLDDMVKVKLLDSISVSEVVMVPYYNLSDDVMEMAKQLHQFKDSHIFCLCWEREAKAVGCENNEDLDQELTLLELKNKLFDPCFEKYKEIHQNVKLGTLTFKVVNETFKGFKDSYKELKEELQIMHRLDVVDKGQWIDFRVQQFEQYHQLHLAINSANVIAKVQKELKLSGDFGTLKTLLQIADEFENVKQLTISCITPELMKTQQVLAEITEKRRACLEVVTRKKDFTTWVKEALEDINELKVFVDLASISAGENDMDVDRVACFHDAVLGYSPLLYELKPESGLQELMQCLKKLWKALENDEKLPKKLEDSARHLQWLKTVKESHGSVELSSLSLATSINRKGIYLICTPPEGERVSPDTVLRLTLPETHGEFEEERDYSLEELKELMNKLMLMSGKGNKRNEEVEMFSVVHSDVYRLAMSFIDLHSSGNVLFRKWEARVYCSFESEISLSMDFNLPVIGRIDVRGELTELLPTICKRMEIFLMQWTNFVENKRSQYYYLNYYTAEQLVYLGQQFELAAVSKEALMLLSFIQPNCNKHSLMELVSNHKFHFLKKRMTNLSISQGADLHPSLGETYTEQIRNIKDLRISLKKEETIINKLDLIWEYYMTCTSSLVPGCMDIEALGLSLSILAEKTETINRKLPPSLSCGRPNLILCPHADILPSALAIYMHSPNQELPTYDEVLLCSPETTFEQMELFLRRCLTQGYPGQKIYTVLYADELSYDVGYRTEHLFQKLQSHATQDYNLVLICNANKEHNYIPSAFSQYKVHVVPHEPAKRVQEYLINHFTVNKDIPSAAAVFKNRTCVGIVSSKRAAVGKSLYVKRLHKNLQKTYADQSLPLKTIRMIDHMVDESKVLHSLLPFLGSMYERRPVIFHFDITSSVQGGISEFLFKLFILQYLMDVDGRMWKRSPHHLYVVEILEPADVTSKKQQRVVSHGLQYSFLDVFPKITCRAPKEVLQMEMEAQPVHNSADPGMDREEFCSEAFQRPYQYLLQFQQGQNLDVFQYRHGSVQGTTVQCLQLLLIYCGILDPSWSELRNFAWFLNLQLKDCESSLFCNPDFVGDTLQGFKNFVVNFMILMAKDFATPSLNISDQSSERLAFSSDEVTEEDLAPFLMRKRWESEPHPYIFFNEDHVSMTFLGFHLQLNNDGGVDAINPANGRIIKKNVMTTQLYQGLQLQKVPFNVDFDSLRRDEKIERLCMVLGIDWPLDPDETYELTTDNVLKILAIHMRFRCGIPVIIMGETGCGKTRLIKYFCELQKSGVGTENMKLLKVHGGTTADLIYEKIQEAEAIAVKNKMDFGLDTVLFFDEANTTDAIGSIKEALCDKTVEGKPLGENTGLHIIAACNPYRKHTPAMIERLESAGLGYRVKADETKEKLGSIPLRQLVYRVHCLPPSMVPLVWDFGQLNNDTERKYIQQIVQRLANSVNLATDEVTLLTNVLSVSQTYMRRRNDECSFVSLRDVERCVDVFKWFFNHSELLLSNLQRYLEKKKAVKYSKPIDKVSWCLVLALGVCYHASLEHKAGYREIICKCLPETYTEEKSILQEITMMQDLFLSGARLRETIARNLALKENVFMMVICIELKIPLFLVGKPGSSKSLAKTIVADAMQGQTAHEDLYRQLKQIHLVSFQCSPHSTPEGIIGTFKQCARFQKGKNLEEYVSVVVLDEIGLAEDSPKMPLKTLHPLLEDGCIDNDPQPHKKVGFIGISNWALDPAKMNRGIFVSRGDPDKKELIASARGICSSNKLIQTLVQKYFSLFADAYREISSTQREHGKEFFGLRDFYSLIKMVFTTTKRSKKEPTIPEIVQAVLRNFSGKDDIDALYFFKSILKGENYPNEVNTIELIKQNINSDDGDCRYLLVLTKNYAALQVIQQECFTDDQQPEIIFGSSFPRDQEYTQICRNINRVKICMETGQMVILLNLQNLYESLYDALNQYYVYFAGQKYVDLGLGTHRVKCRVHPHFRLIVIEEKEIVYEQFPIPLINRLEKHYLDINTVLSRSHRSVVQLLENWVEDFTNLKTDPLRDSRQKYSRADVFVGYHSDTCASVVLQVTEKLKKQWSEDDEEYLTEVIKKAKTVLLNCATPDSVIRLYGSNLSSFEADSLAHEYFRNQEHNSLGDFLSSQINAECDSCIKFTEITTFSRLLTPVDTKNLQSDMQDRFQSIAVLCLQQFDTEYSFLKEIRTFFESFNGSKLLIIQTDFEHGSQSAHLIASAKYSAVNEINKARVPETNVFVYFITKLSRMEGEVSYVGFHGGLWQSVHIDDLRKSKDMVADVTELQHLKISQLFRTYKKTDISETISADSKIETSEGVEEDILMECEDDAEIEMESENEEEAKAERSTKRTGMEDPARMEIVFSSEIGEGAEMKENADEEAAADMEASEGPQQEMQASDPAGPETPKDALDTTTLIRSCVQSAVGMLRDDNETPTRSTRRIEILLSLLSNEDELRADFLELMKNRLYDLLNQQEERSMNASEWVVKEASNPDALHEAGTFRYTLWKRIQAVVTPFLAHVVSMIDRDSNLELLLEAETCLGVKKLWIFIFKDLKLLNVPYTRTGSSSQADTILVQNYMKIPERVSNSLPFSWRIKDYLEEIYSQAQFIRDGEGTEKFVDIFIQTPLGKFISKLNESDREELFLRYVRDFLLLSMSVSSLDELQYLQMALLSCIDEIKASCAVKENAVNCLPWVNIAYHQFMHRLHNFSRILAVNPRVVESLTMRIGEVEAGASHQMVLDVFAAVACVEMLEVHVLQPSPRHWLRLVKNLQMPLEVIYTRSNLQGQAMRWLQEVRMGWNCIFSMALFVEHVLLGVETHEPELLKLVKEHTVMLGKCLRRDSDMKTERPFTAVIEVLHKCRDAASCVFSRFGLQVCPICLGDPEPPILLPCNHMYCGDCIKQWLTTRQMNCPLCKIQLPDDYCVTVSKELSTAIGKNAHFRNLCNSFFIDLVSTLCFKDNVPPNKEVILQLLSLLFLNKKLCDAISANRTGVTKSLSPFDDSVDKSPVIRSVILKLLLKYSFDDVKEYVQQYLSSLQEKAIMDEDDKTEMYALFVNCLEDSMYEKVKSYSDSEKLACLKNEGPFLEQYLQLKRQRCCQESSIEYLQRVARIRLCLDTTAELLFQCHSNTEAANVNENQMFLRDMEKFCKKASNDWFQVYLVRKLTNQYGMEFVQKLSRDGLYHWVFPPEIIEQQRDQTCKIDLFLVYGEGYRILRDAVGTALIECKTESITAAEKEFNMAKTEQAVYLLLTLFREITVLYSSPNTNLHPKPAQLEAVNQFIQESTVLESGSLKKFAFSLVANNHPALTVTPGHSSTKSTVMEMLVHTAAVLLNGQNRILDPLKNLAFTPANMQNSFFPTMPADLLIDARSWTSLAGLHWYQCPNGHYCTVGECGQPMQVSRCLDCGATIGGVGHKPEAGFQMIQQVEDRTRTGHILGDSRNREVVVSPDRDITPVAFILLRLLTHLAMTLGATKDPKSVLGTIKPHVTDAETFLLLHIEKDLHQLKNTLGKSADETIVVVHQILCSLLKEPHQHPNQWPVGFDGRLSTKQSRDTWENILATTVINPEIQNLEKKLLEVNTIISHDNRISSNPVVKIVYGDPKTFLSRLPRDSHVHCSKIWSCRKRISIEYLWHLAQQKDGKDTVPILWKFLQKDAELRLVKFLPDILALQRDLVKRFQNCIDIDFNKITEFLSSVQSDGMRGVIKGQIEKFLIAWNELRPSIDSNGELKLPKGTCDAALTMESNFNILLPRRQGPGLCATALVSYLISIHNDVVYTVEKYTNETRKYSVSPSEVSDLHVISYEVEKDLIPIVLSNCQYSIESGGEMLQELDLDKIQRQVTSRFLHGKPIITIKGIPTLVCRQDRNYENMFSDISMKLRQDTLSNSMINSISGELHSYSDICEALSMTEVTLGFLATAGGESEQPLVQYVEEVLQMRGQTNVHVLEALSRCLLKHAIALWQLLSARKSEHLIRLKRDPFAEVPSEYKGALIQEDIRQLNVFLAQTNLDIFLLELHEMIVLKLKRVRATDEFKPSWSLRDTLAAYIETKREEPYLELEDLFPEEIPLSKCVEAWKAAASLKRDRLR